MSSESAAPSPAAPTNPGDGKKTASANVSQAEAIAHFIKRDSDRSAAPQTADTKATETAPAAPVESTESPAAAEPVQPDSPEAESSDALEAPAAPEATQTEGEAKPEGEADDVLSPESQQLDHKVKEKIQKRIDKEVGKRKALEAQLEQVKQQMGLLAQQAQQVQPLAPVAPPVTTAPLPDIKDPAALVEYRNQAKQTVRWAEEVLDRDDIDQGVTIGEKTYTKADIKAIRRNAQVALEDKIPAQQEYFQQQTQAEQKRQQVWQVASAKFPFLAKNAPEVEQAVAFFNQNAPGVMQSPAAAWIVGAYIQGIKSLPAEQQEPAKEPAKDAKPAAPVIKPKPKPPGDQTAITTTASAPRTSAAATPTVRPPSGNQSANSAAQYLAQMDALRQQRRS